MNLKIFLIIAFCFASYVADAQLFYRNEKTPVDGVEISYRFFREKFFDRDSPLTLRFKLKNTNNFDVNVKFNLVYEIGLIDRYESGEFEICIPKNRTRRGKKHELAFEVLADDRDDFESEDNYWEFKFFDVEKVEECD